MFQDEKVVETKICRHCSCQFDITDKDLEFYDKVSPIFPLSQPFPPREKGVEKNIPLNWGGIKGGVLSLWNGKVKYLIPAPTLCPDCRQQRRLSFSNPMNLYKNICWKCSKEIVSRFAPNSWFKNYCNECWSGEDWNQLEYWLDIDFNKSIFEQINYLVQNTPFQNLIWSASNIIHNSVYTNHTSEIHSSYFVFEANTINNSLYGFALKKSDSIVDSCCIWNSEYLYECVDCYDMFNSFFSRKSFWCKFSYFLDNCYNCSYCIACSNLNNKTYHLFNEPITKEKYSEIIEKLGNYSFLTEFKNKFNLFTQKNIVKSANLVGSENCLWNNIINSNDCILSFDVLECNECKYCTNVNYSDDLFDISSYGEESGKMYESVSVWRYSHNILFSSIVWKWENLIYCIDVKKSKNCFACVNLENKEYCILNKQYTKEEYENLVPKIIEFIMMTPPQSPSNEGEARNEQGEWWEFFPASLSPFWYNETLAQEYFPLSRNEVISSNNVISSENERSFGELNNELLKNDITSKEKIPPFQSEWQKKYFFHGEIFNWSTYESPFPKVEKIIPASKLLETIVEIPDDILNWAIECEVTKKPFRIIKQELDFYRKHNLPIPRKHPNQRHLERMKLRNPRRLFKRKCYKCGKEIQTTYNPERPEMVYCEECYEKEIY